MDSKSMIQENQISTGIITSIKKYGLFLSFDGGYIGLLHISQVSENYINDLTKYFHLGDTVKVLIKEIDPLTKFLTLSIKDLPPEENDYKEIIPSKRITNYLSDIDFSKIEKNLSKMITAELERDSYEKNWC